MIDNCVNWIYEAAVAASVKYYSPLPVKWQKSPYTHKMSRFILTCCSSSASYCFSLFCFLPVDRKFLHREWKSFLKFFLLPLSPAEKKCCYEVSSLLISYCGTGNYCMDIHMIGTLRAGEISETVY